MVKQQQQAQTSLIHCDYIVCLEFAELNLLAVTELLGLAEVGDLQPEVIILEGVIDDSRLNFMAGSPMKIYYLCN